MAYFKIDKAEWPLKPATVLRFFYLTAVFRKQCGKERITFCPETQVIVNVPDSPDIRPYVSVTCPVTGSTLLVHIEILPERPLVTQNDAIAYFMRTLCKDAIKITNRDITDLERYPARKVYDREYYVKVLNRLNALMNTFEIYNHYPNFD